MGGFSFDFEAVRTESEIVARPCRESAVVEPRRVDGVEPRRSVALASMASTRDSNTRTPPSNKKLTLHDTGPR